MSFADAVIEIVVDEGAARFSKGAGEFRGAEFKKKHEDDEVREAEDENGADLAEDGGEEFVVEKVADVAARHFSSGGGSDLEPAGTGKEGVGERGAKGRGGELEEAGPSNEKNA